MSWKVEDVDKAQKLITELTGAIGEQQKILHSLIDSVNEFADWLLIEVKKARDEAGV